MPPSPSRSPDEPIGGDAPLSRVTAIVVTFESRHCVDSLATSLRELPHVVVVDNASGDGTLDAVRDALPHARRIRNERNVGFGAANNAGIDAADTEFVLLVNPDCSLDSTSVQALVAAADRFPEASAVGPQLLDDRGRVQLNYRWRPGGWTATGPAADAVACVGFLSGACLLARRDALRRIGGFDRNFFLYYEDDDLCVRLQRDCGPLIVEPASRIVHRSRGSVGGPRRNRGEYLRGFHHIQSKFRFDAKHRRRSAGIVRRAGYVLAALLQAIVRLALLDPRRAARAWGRVSGVWHYRR